MNSRGSDGVREVFGYGEASEGQGILAAGKGRGAGRGKVKAPPPSVAWEGLWIYMSLHW